MSAAGLTPSPCRFCGAPILWAQTKNGRAMPVDAAPFPRDQIAPSGRWRLVREGGALRVFHDVAAIEVAEVWVAHFATCPAKVPSAKRGGLEPAIRERLAYYEAARAAERGA